MFVTEIHFFRSKCHLSLWPGLLSQQFLGEKWHEYKHEDIRSTLDFHGAASGGLCNRLDGRERPDQNRDGQSVKPEASGSIAGTLSAGNGVHASETVHTGSSGQADLRFLDNSNLTVGPGSSVRLDKFVYDPNKGSGSVAVEASRGAFRFVAGSQNKGEVKVKTPSGTLGIRG